MCGEQQWLHERCGGMVDARLRGLPRHHAVLRIRPYRRLPDAHHGPDLHHARQTHGVLEKELYRSGEADV